jgi:hypothetical protein
MPPFPKHFFTAENTRTPSRVAPLAYNSNYCLRAAVHMPPFHEIDISFYFPLYSPQHWIPTRSRFTGFPLATVLAKGRGTRTEGSKKMLFWDWKRSAEFVIHELDLFPTVAWIEL